MRDSANSETVAEQIASLRRPNGELAGRLRLLTQGVVATAVLGLLVTSAGAHRTVDLPKSIEVERFVVRDTDGKVRMELDVRDDGSSGINLFDPDGRKRIGLAVTREGAAGLGLRDVNDEQLVSLDLHETTGARLILRDAKRQNNVVLRGMPTDDAFIGILGPKEEVFTSMATSSKGRSMVLVRNRDQSGTSRLGVDTDGTRELALFQGLDRPRFFLNSSDNLGTRAGLVVHGPTFPQVMNLTYELDGRAGLLIRDEKASHQFPKAE